MTRHNAPAVVDWEAPFVCYVALHMYEHGLGYDDVYVGITKRGLPVRVREHVYSNICLMHAFGGDVPGALLHQHIVAHGFHGTAFVPFQVVQGVSIHSTRAQWEAAARRVEAYWISILDPFAHTGWEGVGVYLLRQ